MAGSNTVCLSNRDVEMRYYTKVVQERRYESLKPEQLQIVTGVLLGRDVFGELPTGLGKSLCFTCLPFAYKLYPKSAPSFVVMVVSLLTAIMQDYVSNVTQLASRSFTAKFYHYARLALFIRHR